MARSKSLGRGVGELSRSGTICIAGLLLLLGSGLSWAGPPDPTPRARIAHGRSELGAEGLLQRPEQCSGNRVIVRRLDPISRVAPPEIAHSRQYLIELMHILDTGLDHCHQ